MKTNWILAAAIAMTVIACGDDGSPTSSSPSLDTAPRQKERTYQIQRWDARTQTWDKTTDVVTVLVEWRFVSSRETATGVLVNGGYTIAWTNPTSEKVDVSVTKLLFQDASGIPVAEVVLNDAFVINPQSDRTRTGTFEIALDNLAVSSEVIDMTLFAGVGYPTG